MHLGYYAQLRCPLSKKPIEKQPWTERTDEILLHMCSSKGCIRRRPLSNQGMTGKILAKNWLWEIHILRLY